MKNFYDLLAEKARLRPAHPCIVEDEIALSYDELLRCADKLAEKLPAKTGDAVLVLADTFTRQAAAFFAAQKKGARPILLHHGLAPEEETAIFKERGLQGFWRLTEEGESYEDALLKAYRLANTDLVYRIIANPQYRGMGTTMVCATVINDRAIVVNVGDSRCYHISSDIRQVTRDHSIAEELANENAIDRDSDKYKEYKSQLSRAFGAGKKIEPDFFEIELSIGDYILLCSDGLSNMVTNERMFEIINKDAPVELKVDELINEANKNGGRDNIAIILLYIDTIDKTNSVFEKEKEEINRQAYERLKKPDSEKRDIRTILDNRASLLNNEFRNRSRRRKESEENEK